MKLKVKDTVKVTVGKDRGQTGKIKQVFPKRAVVWVEGVNKYKRHMKAQGQGKPGGIIDIEKPLPIANLALICPTCKQQTRVGYKVLKTGGKERICRKCEATIK